MKTENQKLRIIYLIEILTKYTDEKHYLNATQIMGKLKEYGIDAERKTVYADINALEENNILDIDRMGGRNGGFRVLNRNFELAELKMLVDAVQASKFISNKQCTGLIKKISEFANVYDEKKLSRSVYVYDRISDTSKNAYYMIDSIHEAISENRSITFQYIQISPQKKREKRHDGKMYSVSPFALIWRDEFYYLIAYDHEHTCIRHYRVDKMENISIDDTPRLGKNVFEKLSLSSYSSNVFEMFGGKEYNVHFSCKNELAGAMIDRFGSDITFYNKGDHFEFYAPVQTSVRFFGWVFGFNGELTILSPENVVNEYKLQLENVKNSLL